MKDRFHYGYSSCGMHSLCLNEERQIIIAICNVILCCGCDTIVD